MQSEHSAAQRAGSVQFAQRGSPGATAGRTRVRYPAVGGRDELGSCLRDHFVRAGRTAATKTGGARCFVGERYRALTTAADHAATCTNYRFITVCLFGSQTWFWGLPRMRFKLVLIGLYGTKNPRTAFI